MSAAVRMSWTNARFDVSAASSLWFAIPVSPEVKGRETEETSERTRVIRAGSVMWAV